MIERKSLIRKIEEMKDNHPRKYVRETLNTMDMYNSANIKTLTMEELRNSYNFFKDYGT